MDGHAGRAGEQLETAEQNRSPEAMELLKAELLATVSHELRSPLASIKGYAATLLRHESRISREERHEFLVAIAAASDRLDRKSTRLNSSHLVISYAVFCLKKKKNKHLARVC